MHIPIAQPQMLRDSEGRRAVCICPRPVLGACHHALEEPGFSAVVIDTCHSLLGEILCLWMFSGTPAFTPGASSIPHPKMRPPDICSINQLPPRNGVTLGRGCWVEVAVSGPGIRAHSLAAACSPIMCETMASTPVPLPERAWKNNGTNIHSSVSSQEEKPITSGSEIRYY